MGNGVPARSLCHPFSICPDTKLHVQAEGAAEAQAEIAKYNALKKRHLLEGPEGEPLPSSVVQRLNKANSALFETLMELEMSQVRLWVSRALDVDT
eukprot:scaffold6856_cov124-Isochrysis_galbana.AAC.5